MIALVIAFLIFSIIKTNKKSVSFWMLLIYLVSLMMNFLLEITFEFKGLSDVLHAIWVIIVLSFLIMPWSKYKTINVIQAKYANGIDKFCKYVGALCIFMTVGCFIIAYAISQVVTDIDAFKYRGEQEDVYAMLGLNMKPFLLAYIFYSISYFFTFLTS